MLDIEENSPTRAGFLKIGNQMEMITSDFL